MNEEIVSEDENEKDFKHEYEIKDGYSTVICSTYKFSFVVSCAFIDNDEDENKATKIDNQEFREFAECVLDGQDAYLDVNFDLVKAIDSIIELSAGDINKQETPYHASGFIVSSKDREFFKGLRGLLLSQACRLEHLTFDDEL